MQHLEDIRLLTKTLLKSSQFHALVIQSPPGWGKSTIVEKILTEESIEFRTLGTYSTPLFLYNAICENPDRLIVIDDCAGLFNDPLAMSILKAAAWQSSGSNGERRVAWGSTSSKVAQDSIIFKGKFILLTNAKLSCRETDAFLSRVLHLCISFTPFQTKELILKACKNEAVFSKQDIATEVANFISENLHFSAQEINLRTLKLGYELALANPENWKRLLTLLISANTNSSEKELLFPKEKCQVSQAFKAFHLKTGLSRRTFFNYRKRLLQGKEFP